MQVSQLHCRLVEDMGGESTGSGDAEKDCRPASVSGSSTRTEDNTAQHGSDILARAFDKRTGHGEPDGSHHEIEAVVPGHELDVELARVSIHNAKAVV